MRDSWLGDTRQPIRLYIGSGAEKPTGWLTVDANPSVAPDIVALANQLAMFRDCEIDEIEACHVFEHLTFADARSALKEWYRVLRRGGCLMLELPNLRRCFEILGQYEDPEGYDLGMIGIFGWPPMIAAEGTWQIHKWGWTPESLTQELVQVGFCDVTLVPVRQIWRRATIANRDMRLQASKQ